MYSIALQIKYLDFFLLMKSKTPFHKRLMSQLDIKATSNKSYKMKYSLDHMLKGNYQMEFSSFRNKNPFILLTRSLLLPSVHSNQGNIKHRFTKDILYTRTVGKRELKTT